MCAAVAMAAVALAGCGSSGSTTAQASKAAAKAPAPAKPAKLAAPSEAAPPYQAPDFTLRDSLGHTVSLSDYRGKAVLLTFIYDHCPDVCPLIVSSLHNALAAARAAGVQGAGHRRLGRPEGRHAQDRRVVPEASTP